MVLTVHRCHFHVLKLEIEASWPTVCSRMWWQLFAACALTFAYSVEMDVVV